MKPNPEGSAEGSVLKLKEVLVMWKKVVCLFLILSFIITIVGCGGVPTVPPISPEPEGSFSEEFVLVQVTDPESNLIFVTGKENEDAIAILGEKDIEGNPTSITGAVYVLEKGNSFGIEAGIDGLPTYAIDSEGNKVIFKNYTNSTVDVSIYDSNGDLIQGLTTINIDPADLLELKQLYNSFYSKQRWSMKNTADSLKWGAVGLSWTGCAISTAASTASMAATVGIAIIACSNAMTSTIAAITPDDTDNMISTAASTASCLGIGGLGCASTILDVVNLGIEAAEDNETEIPEPTEAIFQWGNLVLGGISCHLVWKDNSDNEERFRIERRLYPSSILSLDPDVHHVDFRLVIEVGPDVQTYTDVVPLGAIPEYRIAAIAADGRISEWTTFPDAVVIMGRPTELQAEVSGSPLYVKLSWKYNSLNELGFRIYRWTGIGDEGPWLEQSDTEWPLLGTVGANGKTFTDVEVKSGYTHRYFVVAFNDDETSLPSNVETVFIPSQQPTADFTFNLSGLIVNFTDTSTNPDNNIVSWYWDFNDDKTSDTQNPIHTYLKAGTYDVTLTVTNTAGFTSTKTQTITICNAPGSFNLSAITECNGTTSQVRLNWTNSNGVSSYDVYRNSTLYYSGLTGTQYINSGNITVGTAYSYYIIAKNSCGSTASNIVSATAISCGSTTIGIVQLSSPSNGATISTSTVVLSWGSVSGTTGYEVVYDTSSSFTNPIGWSVPGTSQTTGTLTNDTIYYWRVRAFAGSQYSSWSSVWSFTKSGAIVPPTGLSVSSYWNTVSPGFPSIVLSWNAVSGATGYEMWVRPSGGSYASLGTRYAPYVTFNSNSLPGGARYVSGTTYYFKVRTVTASGTSDFTSEVSCVAAAPPPSSQVERITNGSFSSGISGWTLVGDFWAGTNFSNYRTPPGYAAGGVNNEGLPINNAAGWMYQTVTIPSGATSATLSYWYNITSYNPGPNKVDFLTVYVSDSGGNWLDWIIYSNLDRTYLGDYKKKTFDLTAHKGKTVTIRFLATSDYSNTTTFRIDDVSLMSDG